MNCQLNNHFIKILSPTIKELIKFETHINKILSEFLSNNRKLNSFEKKIAVDTIYAIIRNYFKINQLIVNTQNDHLESTALSFQRKLESIPTKHNITLTKIDPLDIIGIVWIKILKLEPSIYEKIDLINFAKFQAIEFSNDELSTYELPQFILDKLSLQFPSNYKELILALGSRANVDIRVNTSKTKLSQVHTILDEEKIPYIASNYSPYAIRLVDGISPKHHLVINGMIEFQDESSQLAALLLSPKRGSMVVDFCAGSGGKALFFGMLMRDTGRIYAFDNNMRRLNNLGPRLEKSGLNNIHTEVIMNENDQKVLRFTNKIDYVFVDAPCSGLGTLRRNPELKFSLNDKKLEELTKIQSSILNAASSLVKPGGSLVYATCSILKEENQDIIHQFLEKNPEFSIVNANTILKNCNDLISQEGFLEIIPQISGSDGFFAARLLKNN